MQRRYPCALFQGIPHFVTRRDLLISVPTRYMSLFVYAFYTSTMYIDSK